MPKNQEFWRSWTKPWSRQQCLQVYTQSEQKIPFRKLSTQAGVSTASIGKWSKDDEKAGSGNWPEQRERFLDSLQAEIAQQSIDRIAATVADGYALQWGQLNKEYMEGFQSFRTLVLYYLKCTLDRLQNTSDDEYKEAEIEKLSPVSLNLWSSIYVRCVEGERQITGAKYNDINIAIDLLEQKGWEVSPPAEVSDLDTLLNESPETLDYSADLAAEDLSEDQAFSAATTTSQSAQS